MKTQNKKNFSVIILAISALVIISTMTSCLAVIDARQHQSETEAILRVEYNGTVLRDVEYESEYHNRYDLYLPEDIYGPNAKHLILYIHGGGWTSGDKTDGNLWCRYLSSRGYTTMTVNYTLQDKNHKTNVILVNNQVISAAEHAVAKCLELGITLEDMAVTGFSAGGAQALLYGLKETDTVLPVRFIFQQSGPTTFDPDIWNNGELHFLVAKTVGLDGSAESKAKWLERFSGQSIDASEIGTQKERDIIDLISPVVYVRNDSVPILCAYGVYDGVVPPACRIELEKALQESGYPIDEKYCAIIMPNSGHALTFDVDQQREFLVKVTEYCEQYF